MTNEFIFGTQLVSIIGYIGSVFILYKILVGTKDATIELLRERIRELENTAPDILLERVQTRLKAAYEEIEKLTKEKQIDEQDKDMAHKKLLDMSKQIDEVHQGIQNMPRVNVNFARAFSAGFGKGFL